MILRISRGWVRQADEPAYYRALRELLDDRPRPPEMLDVVFARYVRDDGRVEQIVTSLWNDMEGIRRVLGPNWRTHAGYGEWGNLISDISLEHFEVLADEWPGLLALIHERARDGS